VKVVDAATAAGAIRDGMTVATGGFGCCGHAEAVTRALARRFAATGTPRDLQLLFASGQGDRGERGLNQLAQPQLVRRVIGGYWDYVPKLAALARDELIEAYNWPQGVISRLFSATAAGRSTYVTRIGLGTFVDPLQRGGRLNARSEPQLLERIVINGEAAIAYPAFPIDVAVVRASAADARGNLIMDREASFADAFSLAAAAHNSGGIVIAQVERIVAWDEVAPQQIRVPGVLVDYVVVATGSDADQTYAEAFNPAYVTRTFSEPEEPDDAGAAREIVVERAVRQVAAASASLLNVGIGIPAEVGRRLGSLPRFDATLTLESGAIGGRPAGAASFGATAGPEAIVEVSNLFDVYDGGGIDLAVLGFGELDAQGRINVAKLGNRLPGIGGFVNISQAAKELLFCGTFTTGGLDVRVEQGRLAIRREGRVRKIVDAVDPICFDPRFARTRSGSFTVITERCVLRWRGDHLAISEIAPGVDIRNDILALVPASVTIDRDVRRMELPADAMARVSA
jgi:propionate CoA-transferase